MATKWKRCDATLGDVCKDRISGFEGTVVAVTEWLNGCFRLTLAPTAMHDGKPVNSQTFDSEQLVLVSQDTRRETTPKPTGGPHDPPARNPDPQ